MSDTPLPRPGAPATAPGRGAGRPPLHQLNFWFLISVHLVGAFGLIAYASLHGVTLAAVLIGVVTAGATTAAISMGYHRLFSHRAYETGSVVRFLLLSFGAAAFQNSAITWAADHRRHHRHVDTPRDPYNAKRGLLYSHIGWVVERTASATRDWPVPDLEANPLLRWQHRNYPAIGAVAGFALPGLAGFLAGDLAGGLLFGGVLRLVCCYHATFAINSLAHAFGSQPYSLRNTSRDSWLAALLTMGEGYHNYHHTFPSDYRNGVRPHQLDPSKWVLFALERLGLAWNLARTPDAAVARARLRADLARIRRHGLPPTLRHRVERARRALEVMLARWASLTSARRGEVLGSAAYQRLDAERRLVMRGFRGSYRDWQGLLRRVEVEALAAASD